MNGDAVMGVNEVTTAALALAPYAAALALIYVWLSVRVVRERKRARVALGTGDDPGLARAVRVHGNFIEYTPLGLVLILLVGLVGAPVWMVHVLAVTLIAGRLIHAWGVSRPNEIIRHRVTAMMLTFATLVSASSILIAMAIINA